jgi:hypothetical protein
MLPGNDNTRGRYPLFLLGPGVVRSPYDCLSDILPEAYVQQRQASAASVVLGGPVAVQLRSEAGAPAWFRSLLRALISGDNITTVRGSEQSSASVPHFQPKYFDRQNFTARSYSSGAHRLRLKSIVSPAVTTHTCGNWSCPLICPSGICPMFSSLSALDVTTPHFTPYSQLRKAAP